MIICLILNWVGKLIFYNGRTIYKYKHYYVHVTNFEEPEIGFANCLILGCTSGQFSSTEHVKNIVKRFKQVIGYFLLSHFIYKWNF